MSTPLQTIVDHLITGRTERGKEVHGFLARFGAGWWGSFVFHFGLSVIATGVYHIRLDVRILPIIVLFVVVYSAIFALVVAAGVPKGSLVRHFSYGVTLPVFAYTIAGLLLMKIRG